jgi:hypothetical protein
MRCTPRINPRSVTSACRQVSEEARQAAPMSDVDAALSGIGMTGLAIFIVAALAGWACFALWYQAPGGKTLKSVILAAWTTPSVVTLIALWQHRSMCWILCFAVAFGILLVWWHRLKPSNDRRWADDVAQMTTGTVEGTRVTLHNVRNFDWRTRTDYTQRWESRSYDLQRLRTVDMILSYWTYRAIAHVLISFGFEHDEHVVFSVEIRRRKEDGFSEIGGFFKEFELSIIAADERDAVRVRTNVRGEDDYLYQIRLPMSAMRSLFLAYVEQANSLILTPRFYNTVTVNCTTLVYHMVKHIVGYLPWDYRLLFSGYLPNYVGRVGGLNARYTVAELRASGRITDRARQADRSPTFSADIRKGMPRLEPENMPPSAASTAAPD